jgi:leucyl aminopeptidase
MLDVSFVKPSLPKSGALVLLVEEGGGPGSGTGEAWKAVDEATGGAVSRALTAAEFKGKKGQTVTVLAPGAGLSRVVAVGLGKFANLDRCAIEDAGGSAAASLSKEPAATIAASGLSAQQAASAALGAVLRSYRFDRYRTKEKSEDKPKLKKLTVLAADPAAAETAWEPMEAEAEGVYLTRDLVSEPGNVLNPVEMAKRCEALSKLGVKVEVMAPKELTKLGFGLFMGVAQGSANEARVVTMRWNGAGGRKNGGAKPLAFVGKGVTFDTGGISIKPAGGMEDMKFDMGGAGAVIGLMAALAGRKAKVDAIGMVGLVENMPSGTAQRPGDVVKSYSGQTVEVINTDAEGRLVLGDLLWYCQQKYDPRFMIDLATLPGAMVISLGHEYAGFFSNDDELAQKLHAAGAASGDRCWRMPLHDEYDKQIKSEIADMKNVGGRPGGAITAAHFIKRFVNDKAWAHLDIAGTAWSTKDSPTTPKGATGYGVRLLNRLVADNYEG